MGIRGGCNHDQFDISYGRFKIGNTVLWRNETLDKTSRSNSALGSDGVNPVTTSIPEPNPVPIESK